MCAFCHSKEQKVTEFVSVSTVISSEYNAIGQEADEEIIHIIAETVNTCFGWSLCDDVVFN